MSKNKVFFNWMRHLENKQLKDFLNLYSDKCMLFQGNKRKTYYDHNGVINFYDDFFFSNDQIFIKSKSSVLSNKHPQVILANSKIEYNSKIYDVDHSIFLIEEGYEWKILCHYTKNN
jgi:hypothetical protein